MKRSDALAPLSREHHVALDAARLLRRASPDTAQDTLTRFRAFWAEHGERHFEIEEELLLAVLPSCDAEWAGERIRREHEELRRRAGRAAADAPDGLRELGDLLHDHVRFEEREVFPLLEARLAPAELAALGERIARAETG
jgi:hemerythrin-like domain-containing protein